MTVILTPALALRYLGQLSTDLRAAVVLDPAGALLAGEAPLAEPASALLAQLAPGARELVVALEEGGRRSGTALVARAGEGAPALVVLAGPLAMLPLLRHDLLTAANGLAGEAAAPPVSLASSTVQASEGPENAAPAAIFAGMALLHAASEPKRSFSH